MGGKNSLLSNVTPALSKQRGKREIIHFEERIVIVELVCLHKMILIIKVSLGKAFGKTANRRSPGGENVTDIRNLLKKEKVKAGISLFLKGGKDMINMFSLQREKIRKEKIVTKRELVRDGRRPRDRDLVKSREEKGEGGKRKLLRRKLKKGQRTGGTKKCLFEGRSRGINFAGKGSMELSQLISKKRELTRLSIPWKGLGK